MTDLLHNGHASVGREDQLPQVLSLTPERNINLTLSERLSQLFGDPLHRLGRDLGPKVAVEWRRCSSLSEETQNNRTMFVFHTCCVLNLAVSLSFAVA